jgi:HrpA-like RNA helicase
MEIFSSQAQKQRRRKRSDSGEFAATPTDHHHHPDDRQHGPPRPPPTMTPPSPTTIVRTPTTANSTSSSSTKQQIRRDSNKSSISKHDRHPNDDPSLGSSSSKKVFNNNHSNNNHNGTSNSSSSPRHQHPHHEKSAAAAAASSKTFRNSSNNNGPEAAAAAERLLPVYAHRQEILDAVRLPNKNNKNNSKNKVVIITAETGSGKSTLVPKFFLDDHHHPHAAGGQRKIVVTQPRRVAAITLATRVAATMMSDHGNNKNNSSTVVGRTIGYKVRFDDCTSVDTRLVYATDGMLLREAMTDPMLSIYDMVFLDEAHERSLQTDILMGIVQRARAARAGNSTSRPLHVVVMSATLQTSIFVDFFGGPDETTVLRIPGRQHPVQVLYTTQPYEDYREAALSTILQIHQHEPAGCAASKSGDILVFLPGQEEIEDLASMLKQFLADAARSNDESLRARFTGDHVQVLDRRWQSSSENDNNLVHGVLVCVMYAALPPEAQLAVFGTKPVGCHRRVILATNIAETSVTLPDVTYVVDCGKYKSRQSMATTGMERLVVDNVSRAQATQRTGRAGRVHPGMCFRLYTEDDYETRPEMNPPEILCVN